MAPTTIAATRQTSAPLESVWSLVADLDTWPSWAPIRDPVLEELGSPTAGGVGALRRFRTAMGVTRERVIGFDPPTSFAYQLVSGLPLRDYRSEVVLAARTDGGTDITWRSTFDAPPGVRGVFWRSFVRVLLQTFSRRLARAAARRQPGG